LGDRVNQPTDCVQRISFLYFTNIIKPELKKVILQLQIVNTVNRLIFYLKEEDKNLAFDNNG